MMDFWELETISFPPEGSSLTPAHHYSEFRFKIYAPIAFRYFRDLFGIQPDDFMVSSWRLNILRFVIYLQYICCRCQCVQRHWGNCLTRERQVQYSIWPTTMNSSSKRCNIKKASSCKNCCPATTWTSIKIPGLCCPSSLASTVFSAIVKILD